MHRREQTGVLASAVVLFYSAVDQRAVTRGLGDIFPSASLIHVPIFLTYTILFDYYCLIKCFRDLAKLSPPPFLVILSYKTYKLCVAFKKVLLLSK